VTERSHFYRSSDGLHLFARDFGPLDSRRTPLLCLAGLTRNSRDFLALAEKLEADRRVLCPDYRGRGRSDYAGDISTYNPNQELADCLALLDYLGVASVVVIGTSRGGIIAMLMAQRARQRLEGVILNDIGPHIEKSGLARIAHNLGLNPALDTWEDAVAVLRQGSVGFEALTPGQWLEFARRVFGDDGGRPKIDYDLNLAKAFPAAADLARDGLPDLWRAFSALEGLPTAVIRGQHSDILSAATVAHMKKRIPPLISVTIADRGHVPFLDEPASLVTINRILSACDNRTAHDH
jgi:pimeloyl-ACP methyl ester carboxylesterase